jgi:ureidoglycolate lyase
MKIYKLTREGFATFGDVISHESAYPSLINRGTAERFHDLANIDVADAQGKPLLSIFRAQPCRLPFEVATVQRHPLGSQAFIPLSRHPYLVVVAPAGEFDESRLIAFLATPGQGVNYAKGVWHHALLALENVSDFIVIDRGGVGFNLEEVNLRCPTIISAEDLRGAESSQGSF